MVRGFVGSIRALATLTLLLIGTAAAQEVFTGTVRYVDERSGLIVFEDGRQVQITRDTTVVTEQPVERLSAITPGTSVVVIVPGTPSASPQFSPYGPEPNVFGSPSQEAP